MERYPMFHDVHEHVVHVFVIHAVVLFYLFLHLEVFFPFIRGTEPDLNLIFSSQKLLYLHFY